MPRTRKAQSDPFIVLAQQDERARGDLLESYRGYMLLTAKRCISPDVKPRVDAEDLVQATMLRAAKAFSTFEGTTRQQFFQWLITIHKHSIVEELSWQHAGKRDPGKERSLQGDDGTAVLYWLDPTDDAPTPSVRMMRDEQALRVAQALMALPRSQSEAIRLRHLEGWPVEQIAAHMGRSVQAAAGLLKRGLATLRDILPPADII